MIGILYRKLWNDAINDPSNNTLVRILFQDSKTFQLPSPLRYHRNIKYYTGKSILSR